MGKMDDGNNGHFFHFSVSKSSVPRFAISINASAVQFINNFRADILKLCSIVGV